MSILGRRRAMFVVRGFSVCPSPIRGVLARSRRRVPGRARGIRVPADVRVLPPVPIEVEVPDGSVADGGLTEEIETAIHSALTFRAKVALVPEKVFGESGYKTRLTGERP